jgi:arylsulfatase A-like enzyme
MPSALLLAAACAPSPTPDDATCDPAPAAPIELPGPHRNLVVISIDTFRRDAMGRYGASGDPTPFLDALAARSLTLDDHASGASWTYPSMICALGGRCGEAMGVVPEAPEGGAFADIPADADLLPTWLREAGFVQTRVTANRILAQYGFERDVDRVVALASEGGDAVVAAALAELPALQADGRRWSLHVHLMDTHSPYQPPAEWLDEVYALPPLPWDLDPGGDPWSQVAVAYGDADDDLRAQIEEHFTARYTAAVRYQDAVVASLWDGLERAGALDDAVVVVLSDHGEQLWDHGLWGHNRSVHVEERAAVAMLWSPDVAPRALAAPTTHHDLVPTLMPMLGLDAPEGVEGQSVAAKDPDAPRFVLTWPTGSAPQQAVDWRCYTLTYGWQGGASLYRRDLDPTEAQDRWDGAPAVVDALLDLLEPEIARAASLVDAYVPAPPQR